MIPSLPTETHLLGEKSASKLLGAFVEVCFLLCHLVLQTKIQIISPEKKGGHINKVAVPDERDSTKEVTFCLLSCQKEGVWVSKYLSSADDFNEDYF